MKSKKPHYHSIIISDVHLGTRDSKARELISFLRATRCRKLILNGDIIDGWALKGSNGKWLNDHTKFVRTILKKMEKQGTEVIYLRGNHDDILDRFLPIDFGNLQIKDEHIHETPQGDYLIVHGDGFDSVTTDHKWVAQLGSVAYELLLKINRLYNRWRAFRGKPFFSLSKQIKSRVKSAVSFVGRYEEQLTQLAKHRKCKGIICGHIHTPANKKLDGGVHYLNSGDWVESLTAIIEPEPGKFELIEFEEYMSRADVQSIAIESEKVFAEEFDIEDAVTAAA
ncbi:MAG: UDP-2,3-diacylglucosamine diphosphatase [Verrucomicrobiales bacterium]|nr:UDP-2,3-diacylglucosamine diphosphatase [Verrucomicrobiales bacterium]